MLLKNLKMTLAVEDSSALETDPSDDSSELNGETVNNRAVSDDSNELFA